MANQLHLCESMARILNQPPTSCAQRPSMAYGGLGGYTQQHTADSRRSSLSTVPASSLLNEMDNIFFPSLFSANQQLLLNLNLANQNALMNQRATESWAANLYHQMNQSPLSSPAAVSGSPLSPLCSSTDWGMSLEGEWDATPYGLAGLEFNDELPFGNGDKSFSGLEERRDSGVSLESLREPMSSASHHFLQPQEPSASSKFSVADFISTLDNHKTDTMSFSNQHKPTATTEPVNRAETSKRKVDDGHMVLHRTKKQRPTPPATPSQPEPSETNNAVAKKESAHTGTDTLPRAMLLNGGLWEDFHRHGNEMIISARGRSMFPVLRLAVSDLDPQRLYAVWVVLKKTADTPFKWNSSTREWEADPTPSECTDDSGHMATFVHQESPTMGSYWMAQPISFDKIKLTNNRRLVQPNRHNQSNPRRHVLLTTFFRYQPIIYIAECGNTSKGPDMEPASTAFRYEFPETCFYAVTQYRNQEITKLKVQHNPMAHAKIPKF